MSRRPNVVIVFPYEDEYGPFRALCFALKAFEQAGCDVVCLLPENARVIPQLRALQVETRLVRRLGTFPRTLNPGRLSAFLRNHLAAAKEIERIASEKQANLIYSLSEAIFCGGLAAARLGLPSITHVMGLSIGSPGWAANLYIPGRVRPNPSSPGGMVSRNIPG